MCVHHVSGELLSLTQQVLNGSLGLSGLSLESSSGISQLLSHHSRFRQGQQNVRNVACKLMLRIQVEISVFSKINTKDSASCIANFFSKATEESSVFGHNHHKEAP